MDENIKTPAISVVMPVYNGEKYLKEAIDSILNQTYPDFELLLINDGSSDGTENIINSYNDKRIVYIKNEKNLGLIKTLNKGLDLSKGDFIARMDQDDISHPKRFEKQIDVFKNNSEIGVCGTWFTCFGEDMPQKIIQHPQEDEIIRISLLGRSALGHPTVMMRKIAILNQKYDENYDSAEDYEFWTRLSKITQLYNIPESLLMYRLHNSNISVLEESRQSKNSKKNIRNQLKNLGISEDDESIANCQILFGTFFKFRYTDDEFRKLITFANTIEYQNLKAKEYNEEELHNIINKKLREAFNKTVYKKISTLPFLLKNRKEIILKQSILDNTKMLAKMILKK